ncbi:uncharacterized protein ISCGN_011487 [Ixodes scapularis]
MFLFAKCFDVCQNKMLNMPTFDAGELLAPDRHICNGKCTCKAGYPGTCKHAAAVALWISEQQPLSKTELPQAWGQPSRKPNIDAKESIEELFGRKKELFVGGARPDQVPPSYVLNRFPEIACPHNDMARIGAMTTTEREAKSVISDVLSAVFHQIELARLQKMITWENCMPVYHVMTVNFESSIALRLVRCNLEEEMTPAERELYSSKVACTQQGAECIAVDTVLQAGSKRHVRFNFSIKIYDLLWFSEREVRLSSSIAHRVVARRRPFDTLAQKLLHRKPFTGKAVTYGRKTEAEAREVFEKKVGASVTQVGLIVHLRQPWLCASPDGFFKTSDETTLLEIKCPYSRKNKVLIDVSKEESFVKYIVYEEGRLMLKKRHTYYTQVQIAMYVTNTTQCFFYVYSSKQDVIILVERDEGFLSEAVPRLELFYFRYYLKELLQS